MGSGNRFFPIPAGDLLTGFAAVAAALWLGACAGSKKKPGPAGPAAPLPEVAMTSGKGDTAASVDLGFGKLDSTKAPSEYASQLYLMTLDNFLAVAGGDAKVPEVMLWKGNHYYNSGDYAKAKDIYESLLKKYPVAAARDEAQQMLAQTYAQTGQLEESEKLYRSMLTQGDGGAKTEAKERLAQSLYLQAEKAEKDGRLQTASDLYVRVAKEFPAVEIAPVALFNAGVMQEKQKKWKDAIAMYGLFFDAFFESKLLPKVLFREAKCREFDGQWQAAGEKYLNLAKTYPAAEEAEPSLYNAGFAFTNGKVLGPAAQAFENYALKFPQNAESPNLLFRAVELYGELKNWDKVAELQAQFTRRYAQDRGRLIQALCMGGTAAFQRGRRDEAVQLMTRVIAEFAALKSSDPSARFYAAQAQHTLGEIAAARMRDIPLRAGAYDSDLKAKTNQLRVAAGEYFKVLDYRIVDWTMRAAFSLGQGFEDFGTQVFDGPRKAGRNAAEQLDREEEALAALSGAYAKAQQQYLQVLSIARKQEVKNKYVEDAETHLTGMAMRLVACQGRTMAKVPQLLRFEAATPEKAIAGKLQQIGRIAPLHEQGMKYFKAFLEIAEEYELDPKVADSLAGWALGSLRSLGGHYLDAAELARGAPMPRGFQPVEAFFYKVKLLQEGIPKLEAKALDFFQQGMDFAVTYNLAKQPGADSLKLAMGRAMFIQAKCLDLLAVQALVNPPIPADAGPEQRKTYQEKIENVGYQLQDQAAEKYRRVVEKAVSGQVPVEWAELAFARLYQIEPDKWTRSGDVDTVMEIVSGKEWMAVPGLTGEGGGARGGWPAPQNPDWVRVRKGVMKALDYPDYVKTPFRFMWCGDKGQGPRVDSVPANYVPWKQMWAQAPLALPDRILGMDLEVVAPQEWTVLLDGDTLLTQRALTGPWHKGVAKDVFPPLAKKLSRGGAHYIRVWAQNQKPTEGFGLWLKLRVRYKFSGNGPVFPWNQAAPSPAQLKRLLDVPFEIPNFTSRDGKSP
jgi:TolA-binding protein